MAALVQGQHSLPLLNAKALAEMRRMVFVLSKTHGGIPGSPCGYV